MNMIKKLLSKVGRNWGSASKDMAVIQIQQGTGMHFMYTIEGNQLHFHSMPYNSSIPIKQSILLEELTLDELISTITGMGYIANMTSEAVAKGFTTRKSFTLLPRKNVSIAVQADINTFTSKMWEMLYPIARLLEETDNDMDVALQQMFATTTKGKWLDYWATFFNIKRVSGEEDSLMARRIMMTLINLKTNNLAIEELIRFALKSDAKVNDVAPATFEVAVSADYMSQSALTDSLIQSIKGAGIAYLYQYSRLFEENYPAYIKDKTGKTANKADGSFDLVVGGFLEGQFGWKTLDDGFDLNTDNLNSDSRLDFIYVLNDEVVMTGTITNNEQVMTTSEVLIPLTVSTMDQEAFISPSEAQTDFTVDGLVEVTYGYEADGLALNTDDIGTDLFGQYRMNDEIDIMVASEQQEVYDRIQEELLLSLFDFVDYEQYRGVSDDDDIEAVMNVADISYLYKDDSFTMNDSVLNGFNSVLESRTAEGGSMTLYNGDGSIAKAMSFVS